MNLIKLEHKEITNDISTDMVMLISYNHTIVGMIKLSDFNNWYPVFVHNTLGYNYKDGSSIFNPSGKSSIHLKDIGDLLYSEGFEIYIQKK